VDEEELLASKADDLIARDVRDAFQEMDAEDDNRREVHDKLRKNDIGI
jgi:hypothetical protein